MKKKHRNQLISRLLAMCLSVVMMLSMGITASAEITSSTTRSFNVSGFDTALATPTVTAYQIIKVNIDDTAKEPEYPAYTWAEPVARWLTNKGYEKYIDKKLGTNAVADVFKNGGVSTADMTTFLEELAAAIKAGTIAGLTSKNGNVSTTGEASFANMALGEYLIIASGGVKIYQPTTVKLVPEYKEGEWTVGTAVVGDGKTLLVKGKAPTIDKTVFKINDAASADHTVAVGDTVTFKLEADVPEYPEDTTKKTFIISDTVGTGLAYQTGTVKVYSNLDYKNPIDSTLYTTTETNATVPDQSSTPRTFKIEFNENFFESNRDLTKVYVTYDAKVTADAFTGTTGGKLDNDATMTKRRYILTRSI